MAAHTTSPEQLAVDGNPSAGGGVSHDVDFSSEQRLGKAFETLRAEYALLGYTLYRTDSTDGPVTFWAERRGLVTHLLSVDALRRFLHLVRGQM